MDDNLAIALVFSSFKTEENRCEKNNDRECVQYIYNT